MPFHHSKAHIAHYQLVSLVLAHNKVSSTQVEVVILGMTRGTTMARLRASLLHSVCIDRVTSLCAWWRPLLVDDGASADLWQLAVGPRLQDRDLNTGAKLSHLHLCHFGARQF